MRHDLTLAAVSDKLRHGKNQNGQEDSIAAARRRPGLARGRIKSSSDPGWAIAGGLQTRQARRRQDPQQDERQDDHQPVFEKEQGRPGSGLSSLGFPKQKSARGDFNHGWTRINSFSASDGEKVAEGRMRCKGLTQNSQRKGEKAKSF